MTWIFYALVASFSKALYQYNSKPLLEKFSALELAIFSSVALIVLITPALILHIDWVPSRVFYALVGGSSVCIAGAMVVLNAAIRVGTLSGTLPFMAFIPLLTALAGVIVNAEVPSAYGLIGIMLIVIGSLIFDTNNWKALLSMSSFRRADVQLVIASAVLIAVGVCIDRQLLQYTTFGNCLWHTAIGRLTLLGVVLLWSTFRWNSSILQQRLMMCRRYWKALSLLSLLFVVETVFGYLAIASTYAACSVAIMRLSVILTTALGIFRLNETLSQRQLASTIVLAAGAVIIGL